MPPTKTTMPIQLPSKFINSGGTYQLSPHIQDVVLRLGNSSEDLTIYLPVPVASVPIVFRLRSSGATVTLIAQSGKKIDGLAELKLVRRTVSTSQLSTYVVMPTHNDDGTLDGNWALIYPIQDLIYKAFAESAVAVGDDSDAPIDLGTVVLNAVGTSVTGGFTVGASGKAARFEADLKITGGTAGAPFQFFVWDNDLGLSHADTLRGSALSSGKEETLHFACGNILLTAGNTYKFGIWHKAGVDITYSGAVYGYRGD